MNVIVTFLVSTFLAIPVAVIIWILSFFSLDQTFWISTAFSAGGGLLTYGIISTSFKYRWLKKHDLTRKEYRYIQKNLAEAKRKMFRLHKALLTIRQIPSFSQRIELSRLTRKIYSLTKKEPRRFYQAEPFYFSHLDSAVELSEKYALLSAQPRKNHQIDQALSETRRTLEELNHLIEEDLYRLLADDIDQLHYEMDVAKHSIKKESRLHDEGGNIK